MSCTNVGIIQARVLGKEVNIGLVVLREGIEQSFDKKRL